MVYIENSNVINTATDTLAAKPLDQCKLSLPYAAFCSQKIPVFVPVVFLAIRGAKLPFAWIAAIEARTSDGPSGLVIAGHRAKLGVEPSFGNIEFATAVFALFGYAVLGTIGSDSRLAFVPGIDRGVAPTFHRAVYLGLPAVKFFSALWASVHDFFHAYIIPKFNVLRNPTYFAIAEKRIAEAQLQLPLLEVTHG